MQVTNFIKYLDTPVLVASVPEEEIQPLLNEFPYCQTGQLMKAIHLKNNNSILFEQQLKKAASYCTDRNKLFHQLHQQVPQTKEKEADIEKVANESGRKNVVKSENIDELEKEYISAAISNSFLLEAAVEKKEETTPRKADDPAEKIERNLFDDKTTHTFSDWLKHLSGGEDSVEKKHVLSKESKQDLIDKFIQEDPKIQPKKTEFYSPTNMARLSVVDNSDIVSETLALIYVDQEKYAEAIKAYEKLSLKNPEKRSYFASQIKILNQKLK
ncbi:MAG: hypothetical protein J5I47_03670 [Vicingus serpentipes]|nr:hypothetical protein [Vicingus serpentipes]